MSWASRRRTVYLAGVILFFFVLIGLPALYFVYRSIPPECPPGFLRPNGFTSGPCSLLDPRYLQHEAILWARSFKVRDGTYTAAAYVQNANEKAGVERAAYRFSLYDAGNVLVAEREGTTYLMPGGITPIVESRIDTGSRSVSRTYFCFLAPSGACDDSGASLIWRPYTNPATQMIINNIDLSRGSDGLRVEADVRNTAVIPMISPSFVIVLLDQNKNAVGASETQLDRLDVDQTAQITFTWPDALSGQNLIPRIIPLMPPMKLQSAAL